MPDPLLSQPGLSPLFRHRRFWQRLAPYRPLLILAGIWVVLLAIASIAYDQLVYTTADDPPVSSSAPDRSVYPHQRLQGERPDAANSQATAPVDPPPPTPTTPAEPPVAATAAPDEALTATPGISGSALVTLVAICALGCMIISRQLQAPPRRRAKATARSPKSRQGISPHPPKAGPPPSGPARPSQPPATPALPKRLAPYDPSQPLVASTAAHPPTAVSPPAPQRRSPVQESTGVTVVSTEFEHPLDWSEDSLVNQVDLRQRRSLSSFF